MRIPDVAVGIVIVAGLVSGCNRGGNPANRLQSHAESSVPVTTLRAASSNAGSRDRSQVGGRSHQEDGHAVEEGQRHEQGDSHAGGVEDESGDHQHEHFVAAGAVVENHGVPLIVETQIANNWSPEERARRVAARLNMIASTHGISADSIFMRVVRGMPTVFFYHEHGPRSQGHVLATIDHATARQFGFEKKSRNLAYWWRDVLRDHVLIVQGKSPRWTSRYAPPMQHLYTALQEHRKGVPDHDTFERALSELLPAERESLKTLYISVPANYEPRLDDVRAARAVHGHVDKHDEHDRRAAHVSRAKGRHEKRLSRRRPPSHEEDGHDD